jgi:hypothetical protein
MATDPELAYHTSLPVLGVRVDLRSNAPELIAAFEDTMGRWRDLAGRADLLSDQHVEGTLVLSDGDEGPDAEPTVTYGLPRPDQLVISTRGSRVESDAARRAFTGSLTRELLASGQHFRSKVLEAAVLSVVTWLDRQPLHASAVVRDGTALLLAGPSGTGKSTLAYAAARGGLQILSEDTVFVQLRPRLRVWGMSAFVNLPADAPRHFPELAERPAQRLVTGKDKVVASVFDLGAGMTVPMVERAGICVMERSGSAATRYEPLSAAALEAALRRNAEPGFALFDHARGELAQALEVGGAWRLTLSGSPEDNVPILDQLLDRVDERLG